jgi:hypothetical protein
MVLQGCHENGAGTVAAVPTPSIVGYSVETELDWINARALIPVRPSRYTGNPQ